MKIPTGKLLLCGGGLLLAAALCLTAYNVWDAYRAKMDSEQALQEIQVEVPVQDPPVSSEMVDDPDSVPPEPEPLPDYILDPDMEMPEIEIDGEVYIGTLDIPALELSLPVMSEWSYPKLKLAPCRYKGSAYRNDLIICAHNYNSHFGRLKELEPGDEIVFTDADGNAFFYSVVATETLAPTAIDEMESSGWDLTLFTCTIGGAKRVTVRCKQNHTI